MRRHRMDAISLVFGVVFTSLGGLFLFGHADVTDLHLEHIWPIPVIAVGVLTIVLAVVGDRDWSRERPEAAAAVEGAPTGVGGTEAIADTEPGAATGRSDADADDVDTAVATPDDGPADAPADGADDPLD